jgi:hypothetical protein
LRLVKLRAIACYIPLYLYLASTIAVLEVIRYIPLAGDLTPCTQCPIVIAGDENTDICIAWNYTKMNGNV